MKKLYSLCAVVFAALIALSSPVMAMDKHHHGHHGEATHACPMNPSITGQAGDECPKCGMALEPIDGFACPMHPEVTGQMGDECPKCGMKLEASKAASCPHGEGCKGCQGKMKHHAKMQHHGNMKHHDMAAADATHACPMNPSIKGHAGDECPKCGMALEPMDGYACPMHPKVTGQMGDECPKCGMKLTKADGGHKHHH